MEKDVSRRALERAVKVLRRTRALVKDALPYGPRLAALSPADLRRELQRPSLPLLEALSKSVGEDKALELLAGAQANGKNIRPSPR